MKLEIFRIWILIFGVLVLTAPRVSLADTIRVRYQDSYEVVVYDLKESKAADIVVYLKSAGEPVDGFHIVLLGKEDKDLRGVIRSNQHGEATFGDVPAGSYLIRLWMKKQRLARSTVRIGDVKIFRKVRIQ